MSDDVKRYWIKQGTYTTAAEFEKFYDVVCDEPFRGGTEVVLASDHDQAIKGWEAGYSNLMDENDKIKAALRETIASQAAEIAELQKEQWAYEREFHGHEKTIARLCAELTETQEKLTQALIAIDKAQGLLETARRVREKLTEQRNEWAVNGNREWMDAEIAAIEKDGTK